MKLTEFGGDLMWDDGKDAEIARLRAELAPIGHRGFLFRPTAGR